MDRCLLGVLWDCIVVKTFLVCVSSWDYISWAFFKASAQMPPEAYIATYLVILCTTLFSLSCCVSLCVLVWGCAFVCPCVGVCIFFTTRVPGWHGQWLVYTRQALLDSNLVYAWKVASVQGRVSQSVDIMLLDLTSTLAGTLGKAEGHGWIHAVRRYDAAWSDIHPCRHPRQSRRPWLRSLTGRRERSSRSWKTFGTRSCSSWSVPSDF